MLITTLIIFLKKDTYAKIFIQIKTKYFLLYMKFNFCFCSKQMLIQKDFFLNFSIHLKMSKLNVFDSEFVIKHLHNKQRFLYSRVPQPQQSPWLGLALLLGADTRPAVVPPETAQWTGKQHSLPSFQCPQSSLKIKPVVEKSNTEGKNLTVPQRQQNQDEHTERQQKQT